ncbi:MAG TPA: phosphotransferase [Kiloniellaceae bacterium]|nr:phosphotransferase [Kiloniellaceae bacterium]
MTDPLQRVAALACWQGPVAPKPLSGGITNQNFLVDDGGAKYVVRLGGDIPVHQVMRFNELAASRAAHAAGISPEVVYNETGVLVLRFIEGKVLGEADVRDPANLARILPLLRACHRELPKHLRGPALIFWVFHVIRDYGHSLVAGKSRHLDRLPRLLEINETLEAAVGRIDLVFGHNDLLPANLIDDGERLWLIDWDYAGFNSPLFDLANLASNNQLEAKQETWLLRTYFGRPPDSDLWRRYNAMKCASLLRETFWSMVSEIHSDLDFDYVAYTAENLERFERAYGPLQKEFNAS